MITSSKSIQRKKSFSVAKPTISASADGIYVGGPAVTLTCSSSSDTSGSRTYEWKRDSSTL